MNQQTPQYIFSPEEKPALDIVNVPLVVATNQSLEGYGYLAADPDDVEIEIVQWPARGWRSVDAGTGDEAGWVEGVFTGRWQGDVLYGTNDAVCGHYVLGWATSNPADASAQKATIPRQQVMLWHFNYHPDGGQLFFPSDNLPFVVPLALPGDDLTPDKVVAFWCDGSAGLYIHPNIWHEGIFPVTDQQRFLDRQGRVHARVSCDFGQEFGVYLSVPLELTNTLER